MFPQSRQDEFDNAVDYCKGFTDPEHLNTLKDNDLEKLRLWRDFCKRFNWEPTVRYRFSHTCVPYRRLNAPLPVAQQGGVPSHHYSRHVGRGLGKQVNAVINNMVGDGSR